MQRMVSRLSVPFHMYTWVEWGSQSRIENIQYHLEMFSDATNSKRFNDSVLKSRMLGFVMIDLYYFRSNGYFCMS